MSNPTAAGEKFGLRERKSLQPLKSLDPCLRLAPDFEQAPVGNGDREWIKHSWAFTLKP